MVYSRSQIVKMMVRDFKSGPKHSRHGVESRPVALAQSYLDCGDFFSPGYCFFRVAYRMKRNEAKRLAKRALKKLKQPYRKKKRYHLRKRSSGKTNVRPPREYC